MIRCCSLKTISSRIFTVEEDPCDEKEKIKHGPPNVPTALVKIKQWKVVKRRRGREAIGNEWKRREVLKFLIFQHQHDDDRHLSEEKAKGRMQPGGCTRLRRAPPSSHSYMSGSAAINSNLRASIKKRRRKVQNGQGSINSRHGCR